MCEGDIVEALFVGVRALTAFSGWHPNKPFGSMGDRESVFVVGD